LNSLEVIGIWVEHGFCGYLSSRR